MNQKLIHIGVNYLNKKSHSIFHIPQIYCNISNLVVFIQYSLLSFFIFINILRYYQLKRFTVLVSSSKSTTLNCLNPPVILLDGTLSRYK